MNELNKAIEELKKHGCSAHEASEITGYCPLHLLRMVRQNDPRITAHRLGREVIFDREQLYSIRKTA